MSGSKRKNSKWTIEDCHKIASNRGGKCLSPIYTSAKLEWSCKNQHVWSSTFSHIKNGTWCPTCYKEIQKERAKLSRLSIEEINIRLSKFGMKFIDTNSYTNADMKYKISCKYNHSFENVRLRHILNGSIGCPFCNNYLKSEHKFRTTIEKIFNKKFIKARPEWLKNPETNRSLELDCYNEDLRLAFEYDGHFHFEIRKGLNNDLVKTQELDNLKNSLCEQNGVALIRVPFFLKGEEFYNKIIEGLKVIYGENYWMAIRAAEGGTPMPEEVRIARQAARERVVR